MKEYVAVRLRAGNFGWHGRNALAPGQWPVSLFCLMLAARGAGYGGQASLVPFGGPFPSQCPCTLSRRRDVRGYILILVVCLYGSSIYKFVQCCPRLPDASLF